jgi:hypothetical protein
VCLDRTSYSVMFVTEVYVVNFSMYVFSFLPRMPSESQECDIVRKLMVNITGEMDCIYLIGECVIFLSFAS